MIQAIVFLPLIGAVIAGLISIFGAHARNPSGDTVEHHGEVHAGDAHASDAADHAVDDHGHDDHAVEPPAAGSRAAELITTGLLLVGVNTISSLVHFYSIGYMDEDPYRPRFFSYLSLFTFAMLMLVTADNLAQMFFGWEGVGLASYLLIGFWYHKPSANAAAIKAFIVNRVGDFGFALGIFAIFMLIGSTDLETIFAGAPGLTGKTIDFFGWHADALTLTCLLLFMGAMGKSAQ